MPEIATKLDYPAILAFGAALVATLVLAALLTPASWWRRPNLRALSFVVLGTWGIGLLLLGLTERSAIAAGMPALSAGMPALSAGLPAHAAGVPTHGAGVRYRVADDLNLRVGTGTGARRLATVPAGALVTATGARQGDWWKLRAEVNGQAVEGWSSSLWLRRADE